MKKEELPKKKWETSFLGAVHLKEWYRSIDGKQFIGAIGVCELFDQKEIGVTRGGDSSWGIRVSHIKYRNRAIIFPGCQIRAIRVFDDAPDKVCDDFETFEKY